MTKMMLVGVMALPMMHSSVSRADQIKYLARGENALAARLQQVRGAAQSIDIVTYDFAPCQTGMKLLLQDVLTKARQHVKVRVLVDARNLKDEDRRGLQGLFKRAGAEFKIFNDNILLGQNIRSHVKLQLVDGTSYIVGGRNLEPAYFGLDTSTNYIDREAYVYGASAQQAKSYFDELWESSYSSKVNSSDDTSAYERACFAISALDARVAADMEVNGEQLVRTLPTRVCNQVSLVGDAPDFLDLKYEDGGTGGDPLGEARLARKRNTQMHVDFFQGTKKSIAIENWGYMPIYRLNDAFATLRDDKKSVFVLSNFPEGGDNGEMSQFTAILDHYERQHNVGTEQILPLCPTGHMNDAWSLSPPKTRWVIHSKVAVRDHKDVVVGSYNLDPRSYHTNLEASMRVNDCPDLAADIENEFKILTAAYQKDRQADLCHRTGDAPISSQITGWLLYQFF